VRWLFGLVPLPSGGRTRTPENPPQMKKPRHRGRGGGRRALAALRTEGFVRRVARLVRDLLARLRIRRLELDLVVGLDDPADTGRLWGLLGPASALLPLPAPARVHVAPDFTGAVLAVDGRGEVRFVPLALLAVVAAFALSPSTVRALWATARA
jgi:hypothetical protein